MRAELLRRAAEILRSQMGELTIDTSRWDEAFPSGGVTGDSSTCERLFVHPGVGLALADWLDVEACTAWEGSPETEAALAVARLIVGGDA